MMPWFMQTSTPKPLASDINHMPDLRLGNPEKVWVQPFPRLQPQRVPSADYCDWWTTLMLVKRP